ncbi:uncharacterized protein LOC127245390 [Andrographis paniculata]|uniref:uncharacterized protein LOC127245390 n=1 Tax=Andrographis paniculata TaxID=175694 RepID=UPI0021E91882|nr:uncharacterized protein LOC127245390 [Andrographis paniculata]
MMGQTTSTTKGVGVSLTLKSSNAPKESTEIVKRGYCPCCRRRQFLGTALTTTLLPVFPAFASDGDSNTPGDPMAELKRIRPPKPDWYEELFASAMDKLTKPYEAEVAGYKSEILSNLRGKVGEVVEIGVGTGPNLKYYADDPNVRVFGIDPNKKMEKYALAAAEAAGLPASNFTFLQGVGEALPLKDSSADAVVGTLVLCSVSDVDQTLQEIRRVLKPGGVYVFIEHVAARDGSFLRFLQGFLDPLQQAVADGCSLTRNTASNIAAAGFADVDVNQVVISSAAFVNPHVYGIAHK